jgi:hypothetical protein
LRDARSGDAVALGRFARLRAFADVPPAQLAERLQLKQALAAVAEDAGFPTWLAAKTGLDGRDPGLPMWDQTLAPLLSRWFARYDEARASREREGGYLLPYKNQFFVCESEAVRLLGLSPDDPDWERIGHDWVQPKDLAALARLREKRRAALRG